MPNQPDIQRHDGGVGIKRIETRVRLPAAPSAVWEQLVDTDAIVTWNRSVTSWMAVTDVAVNRVVKMIDTRLRAVTSHRKSSFDAHGPVMTHAACTGGRHVPRHRAWQHRQLTQFPLFQANPVCPWTPAAALFDKLSEEAQELREADSRERLGKAADVY
jgi:hypothetical protein